MGIMSIVSGTDQVNQIYNEFITLKSKQPGKYISDFLSKNNGLFNLVTKYAAEHQDRYNDFQKILNSGTLVHKLIQVNTPKELFPEVDLQIINDVEEIIWDKTDLEEMKWFDDIHKQMYRDQNNHLVKLLERFTDKKYSQGNLNKHEYRGGLIVYKSLYTQTVKNYRNAHNIEKHTEMSNGRHPPRPDFETTTDLKSLEEMMNKAARKENYEKAAMIRDKIKEIKDN